jgi:hypothetical protein
MKRRPSWAAFHFASALGKTIAMGRSAGALKGLKRPVQRLLPVPALQNHLHVNASRSSADRGKTTLMLPGSGLPQTPALQLQFASIVLLLQETAV